MAAAPWQWSRRQFLKGMIAAGAAPYLVSASALGAAVPPGEGWIMAGANPARTSWVPEEVAGRLRPVWYRAIEPYISQNVQIIAADGKVFIATARGLYALKAADGETAWVYPTEMPLGHSPTYHNSALYVGGFDRRLHCIDAASGKRLWTFDGAKAGFALGRGTYEEELLLFVWGDGKITVFNHKSGNNFWYRSSSTFVNTGQWVHVAGVLDGGGTPDRLRIFVNGIEETGTSGTYGGPSEISDALPRNALIGRRRGGSEPFYGEIDEVCLWSRALTPEEIRADMFRSLTGSEPGLAGYWRLDEGAGTTAADSGPGANHAALGGGVATNMPRWVSRALNVTAEKVTETRLRISFPAQTVLGQHVLTIGPQIADLVGNLMDQNRNSIRGEPADAYRAAFNLVDVDLELSNLQAAATELWVDDAVHVSWNGANRTGYELLGDWTDAVYLSADDTWDMSDVLLAAVPHTGGLAAGAPYSQAVDVTIPGVLPGNYRIIVRADMYGQEKEAGRKGNNVVASAALPLHVRALGNDGTPVSQEGGIEVWADLDPKCVRLAPRRARCLATAEHMTFAPTGSHRWLAFRTLASNTFSLMPLAAGETTLSG